MVFTAQAERFDLRANTSTVSEMTERAPEMARLFLARVAFGTERLIVCGKRLALV
jgi:hypothetical protein